MSHGSGLNDILQEDIGIAADPLPVDVELVLDSAWTTMVNAVQLDDDPVEYESNALDIAGFASVALDILIDSTLTPGTVRLVARFSSDGVNYGDFLEGFWASLVWEDTLTASGKREYLILPCAGFDYLKLYLVATSTDATNYFTVTIKARPFRGAYAGAHA